MVELEYTIKSQNGIHVRPAGCLARFAKEHPNVDISILHSGKEYKVESMLSIMKLGLKQNDNVIFRLDGLEEDTVKDDLSNLLADL